MAERHQVEVQRVERHPEAPVCDDHRQKPVGDVLTRLGMAHALGEAARAVEEDANAASTLIFKTF